MLVCDFLLRSADKYPEHSAIIYQDREVNYSELAQKVGRLAAGLKAENIKPGEYVAILMPNHLEYSVSYLALNFLGAPVVPINPLLKEQEISYILSDSKAVAVITIPPFVPVIKNIQNELPFMRKIIVMGEEDDGDLVKYEKLFDQQPDLNRPRVSEDDVSACLYTSGTTGKPKGVMLTHNNLVFDTEAVTSAIGVDYRERYLGVLPFYHAFAETVCILAPLCTGASVVILEQFLPHKVLEAINKHRVTIFPAVPAMYAAILRVTKDASPEELESLYMFVSGGSAMPLEMMRTLEDKYGIIVIEGNGPTETSPISYVNRLEKRKHGSVGPPLPEVEVKIVDKEDNEVPTGNIGEITVKGDNVMKGYLNLPEVTAQSIHSGWFHTGDLGKKDEDNYVYIVDRKKDLIIVGGFNVYPREVEEVLYTHPAVAETAVVGMPDKLRGEVPKAYVVLNPGCSLTKNEVTSFCRENIANYKCPRDVEFRDELPRGASSKILKRMLREEY
ncbi:MAG: long-chain fatty acid--CoA ligase [Clostridiales bacterium]|nr:long-chain fatty acid--CoA ligase [Clostridiales bacterium]MCF8022150.1 long-chain fatty acid--CoA ligase [Clostridiales bacterium]